MLQTMQTNFDITSVNMKYIHFKYSKLMKTPQASRDMVPTKCKTKNIYKLGRFEYNRIELQLISFTAEVGSRIRDCEV